MCPYVGFGSTSTHFCAKSSVVCATPPETMATAEGSKYFGISSCVKSNGQVRTCLRVSECWWGLVRYRVPWHGMACHGKSRVCGAVVRCSLLFDVGDIGHTAVLYCFTPKRKLPRVGTKKQHNPHPLKHCAGERSHHKRPCGPLPMSRPACARLALGPVHPGGCILGVKSLGRGGEWGPCPSSAHQALCEDAPHTWFEDAQKESTFATRRAHGSHRPPPIQKPVLRTITYTKPRDVYNTRIGARIATRQPANPPDTTGLQACT